MKIHGNGYTNSQYTRANTKPSTYGNTNKGSMFGEILGLSIRFHIRAEHPECLIYIYMVYMTIPKREL